MFISLPHTDTLKMLKIKLQTPKQQHYYYDYCYYYYYCCYYYYLSLMNYLLSFGSPTGVVWFRVGSVTSVFCGRIGPGSHVFVSSLCMDSPVL